MITTSAAARVAGGVTLARQRDEALEHDRGDLDRRAASRHDGPRVDPFRAEVRLHGPEEVAAAREERAVAALLVEGLEELPPEERALAPLVARGRGHDRGHAVRALLGLVLVDGDVDRLHAQDLARHAGAGRRRRRRRCSCSCRGRSRSRSPYRPWPTPSAATAAADGQDLMNGAPRGGPVAGLTRSRLAVAALCSFLHSLSSPLVLPARLAPGPAPPRRARAAPRLRLLVFRRRRRMRPAAHVLRPRIEVARLLFVGRRAGRRRPPWHRPRRDRRAFGIEPREEQLAVGLVVIRTAAFGQREARLRVDRTPAPRWPARARPPPLARPGARTIMRPHTGAARRPPVASGHDRPRLVEADPDRGHDAAACSPRTRRRSRRWWCPSCPRPAPSKPARAHRRARAALERLLQHVRDQEGDAGVQHPLDLAAPRPSEDLGPSSDLDAQHQARGGHLAQAGEGGVRGGQLERAHGHRAQRHGRRLVDLGADPRLAAPPSPRPPGPRPRPGARSGRSSSARARRAS